MSLMKAKPLRLGKVTIGGKRPAFILGPCVIESEKFVWRMARKIAEICRAESVPFIFKASYDKANRTSVRSYRGIGVEEGCEILAAIGAELKIPVTTDVHSPAEAESAGDATSGDGELAPVLARAAMAAGCDGIFMEVHENPARALSDGPNQVPLKQLPKHLRMLKAIHAAVS